MQVREFVGPVCPICDSENVQATLVDLHKAFGLPGVTLIAVPEFSCHECGEITHSFQSHGLLVREIRRRLCELGRPLEGPEFQFLRESLERSQAQLALTLGTTNVTVSRWENSHNPIPLPADRLLRILTILDLDGSVNIQKIARFQESTLANVEISVSEIGDSRFKEEASVIPEERAWEMVINLPETYELDAA